ncbi:tRNA 2-selenouridine(34) synthase MnmH [Ramlibacter ginsenosidimutans]|uniref:tRNA 2-selenouridine(34) synthase MnmH n=1 Tax=Ramlibacter ginsenosidimutans TaxID=502333 RepID=A0A934TXA5_9BURK|nr:tRNA 2-selenouridine(34) synthase MnmH [Ramlibacter ginsenosidimutans]MBK6009120.1 tRNA 2-selenouridine(34) synthase MnmH [Ramlibacter ginsenosidimutans]
MSVRPVPATEAIARLAEFDAIIDARSENEYAEDHLPDAVNWPSLDNAQRHEVGTLYKQVSPFEARKRGAALVSANIARHIEQHVIDKPKGWKPLVYCWRGGQRSGALSLVLGQIGFNVTLVEGGYKAFRAALLAELPSLAQRLSFRVVCGPTGSGKTRLLQALEAAGAQVLDLEALASHRSSVLGLIPGQPQPTQKRFDTLVWEKLRGFDAARPVYVESESRKVGNVAVPESLIAAMRTSACLRLDLPDDERVQLLLEDYAFFSRDRELFCQRLAALVQLRGREQVERWQAQVRAGEIEPVVRELLLKHYDPGYASSTERNFRQFAQARSIAPHDRSPEAMAALAQELAAS